MAATEPPVNGAAALEVAGLAKTFPSDAGTVEAVRCVDLVAGTGKLVSLIGPSGCGKSTVLNVVAGLEQPTAGEVRLGGRALPDRLGACAYMPQHDALLPWRRVVDNVTLPLVLAGTSAAAARRQVAPMLERFGLGDFAGAWPWQLSGGMRQRAAFLRTVASAPAVALLDEPFGALDGLTRADLQEWLSEVRDELATTVVLVTHDVPEAVYLSDTVVVLSSRPAEVAAVLEIGLPRPRGPEIRETAEFADLEGRLRQLLRESARLEEELSEEKWLPGRSDGRR